MANQCFQTVSFIHWTASLLLVVQMALLYVNLTNDLASFNDYKYLKIRKKIKFQYFFCIFIIITIWGGSGVLLLICPLAHSKSYAQLQIQEI